MSDENRNMSEIYMSRCRKFYSYKEELYTVQFPKEWAMDHAKGSGPHECATCKENGFWNGVFIGYCTHCAYNAYDFERGTGFVSIGKEWFFPDRSILAKKREKMAFNTYLKGVNLTDIGDAELFDSLQMQNHNESK